MDVAKSVTIFCDLICECRFLLMVLLKYTIYICFFYGKHELTKGRRDYILNTYNE